MGIKREANGVWKVGGGVTDGNDYKGVADKKSLLIQLTADGATQESMDNLEYLKAYADYNYTLGQPIFPHDISVWLSNNGKTAAIEADDISLEDGVYTIGGITCEDGTWDFTNAGQSGGGGGGSSDLPEVDSDDNGKVLTVVSGSWAAANPSGGGGIYWITLTFDENDVGTLDKTYNEILTALNSGLLPIVKSVVVEEGFSSFTTTVLIGLSYTESGYGYGAEIELEPGNPVTFISATADGVLTYDAS